MYKESFYPAIKSVFFNAEGRLSQKAFVVANFFLIIFIFILLPLFYFLGNLILPKFLMGFIFFFLSLYAVYANFVISIKRLHDLSLTGWLSILIIAFPFSTIFYAWLALAKGKQRANKYGEPVQTVHPPVLLKVSYVVLSIYLILMLLIGGAFLLGLKKSVDTGKKAINGKSLKGTANQIKELKKATRSIGVVVIEGQFTSPVASIAKDRVLIIGVELKEKTLCSIRK